VQLFGEHEEIAQVTEFHELIYCIDR
jgi:hypothetical protein